MRGTREHQTKSRRTTFHARENAGLDPGVLSPGRDGTSGVHDRHQARSDNRRNRTLCGTGGSWATSGRRKEEAGRK